jgi:FtsH-binding integral membrane protein
MSFHDDQGFFVRLSIFIAAVTVFGFGQLVFRGVTNPRNEPIWVHAHALIMFGWLAIFVAQNVLATRNIQLHRKLGRVAAASAFAIVALGWFTVVKTFQLHRAIPGYSDSYFIAQTGVETLGFLGLVIWAVFLRQDPQSHRRLMLGATVIAAINPALSRLLPVAIAGDPHWGWAFVAVEIALLLVLMRHDRKVFGTVHRATIWTCAVIIGCQVIMIGATYIPATGMLAKQLAGA